MIVTDMNVEDDITWQRVLINRVSLHHLFVKSHFVPAVIPLRFLLAGLHGLRSLFRSVHHILHAFTGDV